MSEQKYEILKVGDVRRVGDEVRSRHRGIWIEAFPVGQTITEQNISTNEYRRPIRESVNPPDFPAELPKLEPINGYRWEYRGKNWSNSSTGIGAFLDDKGTDWIINRQGYTYTGYKSQHYAEAVKIESEFKIDGPGEYVMRNGRFVNVRKTERTLLNGCNWIAEDTYTYYDSGQYDEKQTSQYDIIAKAPAKEEEVKEPDYSDPEYQKKVEQAFKDGKRIQSYFRYSCRKARWEFNPCPTFFWEKYIYRIHPDDDKEPNWHDPEEQRKLRIKWADNPSMPLDYWDSDSGEWRNAGGEAWFSQCTYRPKPEPVAKTQEDGLEFWVKQLMESLPGRRDWLDPEIEKNINHCLTHARKGAE